MADKPILMTSDMVRAILDGRKTQTRRVIKAPVLYKVRKPNAIMFKDGSWGFRWTGDVAGDFNIKCPYGVVGDRLYVRETWRCTGGGDLRNIIYRAEGDSPMSYCGVDDGRAAILKVPEKHWAEWDRLVYETRRSCEWRSPIHMYKWAARLWLEITGIRVEKVRNITDKDAKAEGVIVRNIGDRPYHAFKELWDSINDKRGYGWDVNPWVWIVEFRKEK